MTKDEAVLKINKIAKSTYEYKFLIQKIYSAVNEMQTAYSFSLQDYNLNKRNLMGALFALKCDGYTIEISTNAGKTIYKIIWIK